MVSPTAWVMVCPMPRVAALAAKEICPPPSELDAPVVASPRRWTAARACPHSILSSAGKGSRKTGTSRWEPQRRARGQKEQLQSLSGEDTRHSVPSLNVCSETPSPPGAPSRHSASGYSKKGATPAFPSVTLTTSAPSLVCFTSTWDIHSS